MSETRAQGGGAERGAAGPPTPTGSVLLDGLLGGGLAHGLVLLAGEPGAGATPFALGVLARHPKAGVFAALARSPGRVRRDAQGMLADAEVQRLRVEGSFGPADVEARLRSLLDGLPRGGVIVLESSASLHALVGATRFHALVGELANAAFEGGRVVLLLHATDTLAPKDEARLAEAADVVLGFAWRDGGLGRRRLVRLAKLPGLPPASEGDEVPVLEATIHPGAGFGVLPVRGVL